MPARSTGPKQVEAITHSSVKRTNIPTAEDRSVMAEADRHSIEVAYARRNRDLDPQLVWRGKDEQDQHDLVVQAPPLYIQEKVHPKALIDDLMRRSGRSREEEAAAAGGFQPDLFSDFNGLPEGVERTDFYEHDANWANRMILGDSLLVMASLAEREGLRGKVQCIYIDPPYGIKFNSNFQWSTTGRTATGDRLGEITREPEQVKAFRDTWRDGIHSYLSYLRDRCLVARTLLDESGSVFLQISDENVHVVRSLLDEVFGSDNFVSLISFVTTSGFTQAAELPRKGDYIVWYARSKPQLKYRPLWEEAHDRQGYRWLHFPDGSFRGMTKQKERGEVPLPDGARIYKPGDLKSQGAASEPQPFEFEGKVYDSGANSHWKASYPAGMNRLAHAGRIHVARNSIQYRRFADDFPYKVRTNFWDDTGTGNFTDPKVFVVQTNTKVVERCILLSTDPGDLVLDPTCGSGTTPNAAERWGRRWITIDTSRVALTLARTRVMGARYPYYLLSDSDEGKEKEAEVRRVEPVAGMSYRDIRQGFVYQRVPHVTLGAIANNSEIDVIWDRFQPALESLREQLNSALDESWEDWEIPRADDERWPSEARELHQRWSGQRHARQQEIDASIAAKADFELLYDKPYEDSRTVRVAGPFTVESISPHRVLGVDEDDELIDPAGTTEGTDGAAGDFGAMILEQLRTAGVQQAHKEDRIEFSSLTPWPGSMICAEGRYAESGSEAGGGDGEKRAGIFIGPEFGTVARPDLVEAAREAADAGFDVLIACAFNYEAQATEFDRLGRIPVLKARMNADLHMAGELKNTGKGNLFVIFGEPDIDILDASGDDGAAAGQIKVRVNGVDVFHPGTGEVRSDGPDGIACWFIDTDYDGESFFVRHAYFLGANYPYKALKTTLRAEIDAEAWQSLHSDTSRPFERPSSGRIAVKVINHLGDEVMKVFRTDDFGQHRGPTATPGQEPVLPQRD
ncbi:MAG: site-specific DNA-methyltransferase [Acidimicrobiia bacterium]|nr:site-specific DNA-methyltransferase [Acidimicrobiia bacterium]